MSTTPPACSRKGCTAKTIHHHVTPANPDYPPDYVDAGCGLNPGKAYGCFRVRGDRNWTAAASPRASRKRLAAEVARLSAELADVHDEVADKKDRLARLSAQAESDAKVIASLGRQIAATPEGAMPIVWAVESETGGVKVGAVQFRDGVYYGQTDGRFGGSVYGSLADAVAGVRDPDAALVALMGAAIDAADRGDSSEPSETAYRRLARVALAAAREAGAL